MLVKDIEVGGLGCSTRFLSLLPYDMDDVYNEAKLVKLKEELTNLCQLSYCVRTWLLVLCSGQMKAKAILEEFGFRCLVETPSGHNWDPDLNGNGGMLYFMYYEVPLSSCQLSSDERSPEWKAKRTKFY